MGGRGGVGLDYGVGASLGPVCGVGGTRVGHQGCGWGGRGYGVKGGEMTVFWGGGVTALSPPNTHLGKHGPARRSPIIMSSSLPHGGGWVGAGGCGGWLQLSLTPSKTLMVPCFLSWWV